MYFAKQGKISKLFSMKALSFILRTQKTFQNKSENRFANLQNQINNDHGNLCGFEGFCNIYSATATELVFD